MKLINCAFLYFSLLFISETIGLPRFSVREGSSMCIDCHVNPTGGVMRNSDGWSFGKNRLTMISPKDYKISNMIGENISLGIDFRTQYLYSQAAKRTDFQKMAGSIYTNVDLAEELNVFARYDFIQQIWEAFAVASVLPNKSYIKAGSYSPNFGLRIDDHTAYTRGGDIGLLFATGGRQGLIYEPTYTETGVELGFFISDIALLTASVGHPNSNLRSSPFVFESDPSYTASIQFSPSIGDNAGLRIGGSFSAFKDKRGNRNFADVKMFGGFAGIGIASFTLLAEFDLANDYLVKDTASTALMVEAAYTIIKGLDAIVRYDRFDPLTDVYKDELSRVIIGFEIFPWSFIEVRPQYRIQMEDPSVDNDAFVLQFHFWY